MATSWVVRLSITNLAWLDDACAAQDRQHGRLFQYLRARLGELMTRLSRYCFAVTALAVATIQAGVEAMAASPEIMMAQCRARAGEITRTRLPDIETKYEEQRVDGTHAVNGTAYIGARIETFQCSFNRAGNRIIQFVVNQPSAAKQARSQATLPAHLRAEIRIETVRFKSGRSSACRGIMPTDCRAAPITGTSRPTVHRGN